MVRRNAMMRAGTARRNAGSAVSRRRYAGLAMDCARPLIESARADALAISARAMPRPRVDDPLEFTRPNRCAAPPRIRCHSNRWRLCCRESESIFLVNVSTEINAATVLPEAGIPESFQRVESGRGRRDRSFCNLGFSKRPLHDVADVAGQLRRL